MSNKLRLKHIECDIVNHCNLKCRGCDHFSPICDPWFRDVSEFEEDMSKLSLSFDIDRIVILGGEPLLHKDFMEFLRISRRFFPNSKVEITTNGLLLNKIEENAEEINELNITVDITNYYLIDIPTKIINKIRMVEIWDRGSMYNLGLDLSGSQNKFESFHNCIASYDNYGCVSLSNHRLYLCPMSSKIRFFNDKFGTKIPDDDDAISVSVDEDPSKILEFLTKPHEICEYCNLKYRMSHEKPWAQSKGDINEWICH